MKIVPILFVTLACSTILSAQDPRPTSPAKDETQVVKISTNLIQLDVSVTDEKGKPMTDIRPEELTIFENGVKQKISNFSFISSLRPISQPAKRPEKNAVPIPPSKLRLEQVRRTIAIVVDDLSLSFESAAMTRQALKKFVDEQMQDGDLVAIIRTGSGIGALQQFTSDKRILNAAIERVKWNPRGKGDIGAFSAIEPSMLEVMALFGNDPQGPKMVTEADLEFERNVNNRFDEFRGDTFATGTLGALRYVVTGMYDLPGRKSVILFSDGFSITETSAFGRANGSVLDFLRKLVDIANRSSVVFYTVDSRGLQTLQMTAADRFLKSDPLENDRKMQSRRDELYNTQEGLKYLAHETGGIAIVNNNDLAAGVSRALEDQSFYLVGYEPNEDTFDPTAQKFNKIEVRVSRPNVNVRYRSGFFNVASREKAAPVKGTPETQIRRAISSPFAINDISLSLNPLFGYDEKLGTFVRSFLHIDARTLKFKESGGGKRVAKISILAMSFGDNGVPADQTSNSYTITTDDIGYKKLLADGFVYHFAFPVKKPGAYQYRVAIRDDQAATVGSASQFIEVPNVKKKDIAVSSIVLQTFSLDQWKRFQDAGAATKDDPYSNPMNDTSLRKFKVGSVLRYGFEIYNSRFNPARPNTLATKVRVFRNGKLILDGEQRPVELRGQADPVRVRSAGAISLNENLQQGDYVLQVIVTDGKENEKYRIGSQYVQFEVVP